MNNRVRSNIFFLTHNLPSQAKAIPFSFQK